jgi:hypothetical protein
LKLFGHWDDLALVVLFNCLGDRVRDDTSIDVPDVVREAEIRFFYLEASVGPFIIERFVVINLELLNILLRFMQLRLEI